MDRNDFAGTLDHFNLISTPLTIETLWINITSRCNQACVHCHVGASPERTEQMSRSTVEQCLEVLRDLDSCTNLDITGGAPELHQDFGYIVVEARKMGKEVIVRHNLTVTINGDHGKDKEYLPHFFAENSVKVLASLPHYDELITNKTRGPGVFKKSIDSLCKLNSLGYGKPDSELLLNLVHNCDGPISPEQKIRLEKEFKEALYTRYGIVFNSLMAVTNMPIGRFRSQLQAQGMLGHYIDTLKAGFSPAAADDLVCRHLVSVGHDGRLYDCDFNQMLGMEIAGTGKASIYNFDPTALLHRKIRFGAHCFGCTAGGGSS